MALIQLQEEGPSISAAAAAVQSLAQSRSSSRILKSSDSNLQVHWWHEKWHKKRTLKNRRRKYEGSLAGSLHCPRAVELQIRCLNDWQSSRGKSLLPNTHRRMKLAASPSSSPSSSSSSLDRVLTGFKKSGNGWIELERPSVSSLLSDIKECSRSRDLKRCKKIHSQAIECGLFTNIFLRNSLINVYAKCGSMVDAQKVFDASHQVTLVSWNSLIWGYVNNGECEVALEIFDKMEEGGYDPDDRSYCAAVTACAALGSRDDLSKWLSKGKCLHSRAIMNDCCDKFVESALVEMYSKLGSMVHARAVFDESDRGDVVAWNSLLHGYVATGECELVLELFEAMEEVGCAPNSRTYLAALAACATLAEEKHGSWLAKGQALHSQAVQDGFCNIFVQSILIHLYATCGNMVHARSVFGNMVERNAVAWNALIKGYVDNGDSDLALEVFEDMEEDGVLRNSVTYIAVLSACAAPNNDDLDDKKWVERTKAIQSQAVMDKVCDMSVENSLVNAYGNCGTMVHARTVFDQMVTRNVVSWNSLLQGYAENGRSELALELFDILEELEGDCFPNSVTYIAALTACALGRAECLEKGKALHSRAVMNHWCGETRVKNTLLQMYGKCGRLVHVCKLFEDLDDDEQNSSRSALLQAYVDNDKWEQAVQIFDTMDRDMDDDYGRTRLAYNLALNACAALTSLQNCIKWVEKGKAIHSRAVMNHHTLDNVVGTTLVNFYSASGKMVHAEAVFEQMRTRDVVTWTILLNGYIDNGESEVALMLFDTMSFEREEEQGCIPNSRTYLAALRACTRMADRGPFPGLGRPADRPKWLEKGKSIHSQAAMTRCCSGLSIRNALLSMYGTCGGMVHALAVFDGMWGEADMVSWTALLQGFVENGEGKLALELFDRLEEEDVTQEQASDPRLFVVAVMACSSLAIKQGHTKWGKWLEKGKSIHSRAMLSSCCDTFVEDALINLYGKCGKMEHAQSLFNSKLKAEDQQPSIVSWVALIQGYIDNDENATAMELIALMDLDGITFNCAAFLAALRACGNMNSLSIGKSLHDDIRAAGFEHDPLIGTCLVGFYARCRKVYEAELAFRTISIRVRRASSWPWDSLMLAYGRKREYEQVLRLFQRMRKNRIPPSEITFNHVLSACSRCGLVREGYRFFSEMSEEYGIRPDVFHYNCVVDLLARNNHMEEAMEVVRSMPYEPDAVTWTIVLNAAQLRNNVVVGRRAFEALLGLKEKDAVAYRLLLQIYEDSGMLEEEQEGLVKELEALRPKSATRFARQRMLR